MLHKIQDAVVIDKHTLSLTYEDGEKVTVNLKPLIEKGGVFAALADEDYVAQVEIGERGRFLMWPGELELCADALRVGLPTASIV